MLNEIDAIFRNLKNRAISIQTLSDVMGGCHQPYEGNNNEMRTHIVKLILFVLQNYDGQTFS